ncbi:ATP-binding protein, partial [Escherichia coli]|uniref:ATP-binding protein n=1 Tax=Escherichia coli TaxID=562 RepID=UPI002076FA1B
GLEPLSSEQRSDLLEIVDLMYQRGSIIVVSQLPVENWYKMIGTLFNTAFYSNKQVDDFLAQALKTNDPAEKTRLYKAAQDIIWQ